MDLQLEHCPLKQYQSTYAFPVMVYLVHEKVKLAEDAKVVLHLKYIL